MPFDPWTGQYYPDKNNPVDTSQFGGQQMPDQQNNSVFGTTGGSNPTQVNPAKPGNPYPGSGQPAPSGMVMGPDGQYHPAENGGPSAPAQPDLFNNPAPGQGANYMDDSYWKNSPFYQPGMPAGVPAAPAPQTGMPNTGVTSPAAQAMGTGNPGNDRSKPPDASGDWFWSGTANHWVDSTGKRDATGRSLTGGEQQFWQGNNQRRASGTLGTDDAMMSKWGNTQYPTGFADPYAGATQPFRTPDQVGLNPMQQTSGSPTGQPTAPGAAPAGQGQPDPLDQAWNYNDPHSVPWQAFVKNVFGESNANQLSFDELKGVLDEKRMSDAAKFGWAAGVPANADANAVYRAAIQMAQQNPGNDYAVVRLNVNGQPMYAALMREQDPNKQLERGYMSPAMATKLAQERALAAKVAATGGGRGTTTARGGAGTGKATGGKAGSNGVDGNFIPPNPGGNPVWDAQTQQSINEVTAAALERTRNNQPLSPTMLAALNKWADEHPYSGPYSPENMPPRPGGNVLAGAGVGTGAKTSPLLQPTQKNQPLSKSGMAAAQGVVATANSIAKILAALPKPQATSVINALNTVKQTTAGGANSTKTKKQSDAWF